MLEQNANSPFIIDDVSMIVEPTAKVNGNSDHQTEEIKHPSYNDIFSDGLSSLLCEKKECKNNI